MKKVSFFAGTPKYPPCALGDPVRTSPSTGPPSVVVRGSLWHSEISDKGFQQRNVPTLKFMTPRTGLPPSGNLGQQRVFFQDLEKQSPSHCLPAKWIGAFLIIAGEWTVEGSSYTESKQKWGGGQSCNGGFLRSQNDFCKIQSAVIFNVRARRAREKFPYSTPSLILKIIRFFSY